MPEQDIAPSSTKEPPDLSKAQFTRGPRMAFAPDIFHLVDHIFKLENSEPVKALRSFLGNKNDYLLIGPSHDVRFDGRTWEIRLALFSDGFRTVSIYNPGNKKDPIVSMNWTSTYAYDNQMRLDPRTWTLLGVAAQALGSYEEFTLRSGVRYRDIEKLVIKGLSTGVIRASLRGAINEIQREYRRDGAAAAQ